MKIRLPLLLVTIAATAVLAAACGGGHHHHGGDTPTPTPTLVPGAPVITALSPTSGYVAMTVQVSGTNFGATQGASTVTIGGVSATVTSWSATELSVTVPRVAMAGAADVVVTVDGNASPAVPFTVRVAPFLYANMDETTGNAIVGWSIASNGTLTMLTGSPYSMGADAGSDLGGDARDIRIDTTHFRVVANDLKTLRVFEMDPATGVLSTSNAPVLVSSSALLASVEISPDGRFVWAPDANNASIWTFNVGSSGNLTPATSSPFISGQASAIPFVRPDGKSLYVLDTGDPVNVGAYAVGSSGNLTPLSGSPLLVTGASTITTGTMDPLGRFLYLSSFSTASEGIWVLALDTTGAPTVVSGSPFGATQPSGVAVTPDGKHLYTVTRANTLVVGDAPGTISIFNVGSSGNLTANAHSPYTGSPMTDQNPSSLEVSGDGRFLFCAEEFTHPGLHVFAIASDGGISEVAGSPFEAGTQEISGLAATR